MPTQRILHPEWRDALRPVKYPFKDAATLLSANGNFLPDTLFVDGIIHPVGGASGFYLASILSSERTATLIIGDTVSDNIAFGEIDFDAPSETILLSDRYGRPAGLLVADLATLGLLQTWPAGQTVFTRAATEFVAACCVPMPEIGLKGFVLEDGSLVTADVPLVGGEGVRLEVDQNVVLNPGEPVPEYGTLITVHAVGDPLIAAGDAPVNPFGDDRISLDAVIERRFIRRLAIQTGAHRIFCSPDENGDVKIVGGSQDAVSPAFRIETQGGATPALRLYLAGKTQRDEA